MKRVITLVAVLLGGLALVVGAASAAGAHGGDGVLEVEAAHPTSTGVHYILTLTYQNDGDTVTGAAVTATPISPSGEEGAAVTLEPAADGTYQAAVEMPDPGQWTVRFESTEPPATLEQTAEISETTTTTTPTTGADGSSEGFAPADDGTGNSAAGDNDSGSDSMPILLIVVAAVVAIGGVVTALRIVARNRPSAGPTDDPGGATPPDPDPTNPAPNPAAGDGRADAAPGRGPVGGSEGS